MTYEGVRVMRGHSDRFAFEVRDEKTEVPAYRLVDCSDAAALMLDIGYAAGHELGDREARSARAGGERANVEDAAVAMETALFWLERSRAITDHHTQQTPDGEAGTDPMLLWILRRAGDEWGPAGVAKVAAQLADGNDHA